METHYSRLIADQLTRREAEILNLISEGLSDQQIAEALFLSINTIRWHNRHIYDKLGVKNRTQALVKAGQNGLLDEKYSAAPHSSHLRTLPKGPELIGRQIEIDQIKELLSISRLITLTGPAGVGKTSLALAAAAEIDSRGDFPQGVYLAELAPVQHENRVIGTLLGSLGIAAKPGASELAELQSILMGKKILLVIDNYEHLLRSAPLLIDLLQVAPDLKILVTSREKLDITGEQVFPVACLPAPDLTGHPDIKELVQNHAVDLFLKQAAKVKPGYLSSDEEIRAVGEICRRLDGLPLAIKLAASRLKDISLADIQDQIEEPLGLLADPALSTALRHQGLKKAIDWSYQLLTAEEQTLFNRLSAFRGGFTLESSDQICCPDLALNALQGITSLLNKNLIQETIGEDGDPRFILLEILGEYAQLKLRESGEREVIKKRHAQYWTDFAYSTRQAYHRSPNRDLFLKRISANFDNNRAAIEWTLEEGHDPLLGLRLVGALDFFWYQVGYHREGKAWIDASLAHLKKAPATAQAHLLSAAGMIYFIYMEFDISSAYYKQALALFQEVGDKHEQGWLHVYAMRSLEGNPEEYKMMLNHHYQALAIFQELGERSGIAQAWTTLGVHAYLVGNHYLYKKAMENVATIARETGDLNRELLAIVHLGNIALLENRAIAAQNIFLDLLQRELALYQTQAEVEGTFESLAGAAIALGQLERGITLLSAAKQLRKLRWGKNQIHHMHLRLVQKYLQEVTAQVDERVFKLAWEEGQRMSLEEVIQFALACE